MGGNSVANPMGHNFLGTGGTRLNKPLSFVSPLNPGFLGGGMTGRVGRDVATMGLGEFTQKDPFGIPGNPIAGVFGNGDNSQNPYVSGPFSLDPAQVAGDRQAILNEGDKQYADTLGFIGQDKNSRSMARDELAKALTNQSQAVFKQGLPGIEETLNAQHLLNGSGLGQEIGRQQGNIATNIANAMGVQGAQDINRASDMSAAALQGKQGFQTGALQRGLGLEDFINQSNVAKTIGAQMAPPPPSSKAQAGTVMQGVGAMAPWAKIGKAAGTAAL